MKKIINCFKVLATRRLTLIFDKVDFTYPRLSFKRLKNWFLAEIAYVLKSPKVWAYPTHIQVEPTNICNLRCPLCHVVTDTKPRGYLTLDNFRKLMDETGDYLLFLHFWGWGEPFINKDFFSMIRYAKDKGIKIITSTNGHFFEDEQNIDRLIDSGLDVLIFALDAVDKETYEKYRREGDFERVLKGLRSLVNRRKERGAILPRINLRMLVTRENEHQVESMKKLAKDIGVDIFTLKTLCSFDNKDKGGQLVPCSLEYCRFEYNDKGEPVRKKNTCKKMWNHPTVYLDGSVVPCDYYTGQELVLGNAFIDNKASFRSVWFGEDFKRLRSRFLKGERWNIRCGDCSMNFSGVDRCVSHSFVIAKGDDKTRRK